MYDTKPLSLRKWPRHQRIGATFRFARHFNFGFPFLPQFASLTVNPKIKIPNLSLSPSLYVFIYIPIHTHRISIVVNLFSITGNCCYSAVQYISLILSLSRLKKMFYSQTFLARKGPLGTVWCAAHMQSRLKKSHYTSTDIPATVGQSFFFSFQNFHFFLVGIMSL